MNATQFSKLSLSHQSSYLWEKGVHLCSRKDALYLVHLYAFHNFYVEVFFSYKLCRIESIRVLDSTKGLDTYLLELPMPGYLS